MLFMISCRQASKLMSKKFDQPLSLPQELRLRVHLMICKSCPELHKQFEILQQAGQHFSKRDAAGQADPVRLDNEARARILQKLQTIQQETTDKSSE